MSEYVRVRDPKTGHEYTTRKHLVADGLEVLDKPALGKDHLPVPTKYRVDLGTRSPSRGPRNTPKSVAAPSPVVDDTDGHPAESDKEND